MATRKDAKITQYAEGGYVICIPSDCCEYEADTVGEAFSFARGEGVTRVYSAGGKFVLLSKEDI